MLVQEFCPDCGLPREALFRFCLSCGLDYDLLDATFEPPGGPYSPVPSGGWPIAGFVAWTRPVRQDRSRRQSARRAQPRARRRSGRRLGTVAFLSLGIVLGVSAAAWASTTDLPDRVAQVAAGLIGPGPSSAPGAIAEATPSPTPEPSPTPAPVTYFRPLPDAVEASVVQVLDGSTILVSLGGQTVRVRYIGVQTPNPGGSATEASMALAAAKLNAEIVGGHTVILEEDAVGTDETGRLLRHVWVEEDGRFLLVGLWLIRSGVAEASVATPNVAYRRLYEAAEDSAKQLAIGLWTPTSAELPETGPTPGPSSGPAVSVPLRSYTSVEPIIVPGDGLVRIEGVLGRYTWRTVNFSAVSTRLNWSVVARGRAECIVHWTLTSQDGEVSEGTIATKGRKYAMGQTTLATTAAEATLVIESTCGDWAFGLRGLDQ